MTIDFDDYCSVHPISGDVFFRALVDNAMVSCRVTEAALRGYFAASAFADLESTFKSNRGAIETKAREQIIAGRFVDDVRSPLHKSIVLNMMDFPASGSVFA